MMIFFIISIDVAALPLERNMIIMMATMIMTVDINSGVFRLT